MKEQRTHVKNKGFTLVEVIAVLTIIGVLVGVMLIPFLGIIESARMRAERQNVALIATEIKASFRQDDIDKNISALLGDMPIYPGPDPRETVFEYGTPGDGVTVSENAWYGRLAKMRGQPIAAVRLDATAGDIYAIAFNAYKNRRVLLVGPREAGQQRYIILSFMFTDGPALPAAPGARGSMNLGVYEATVGYDEWFNAIYAHTWGETSDAPTGWTAAFQTAWNVKNARGRSYAERVVAERIVQPRYSVVVNNNSAPATVISNPGTPSETSITLHPDRVFIYSNMLSMNTPLSASLAMRIDARQSPEPPARQGPVLVFPSGVIGILEGRRLLITRKQNATTDTDGHEAPKVLSILLNENTTYTAQ